MARGSFDLGALETYCQVWTRWRKAERDLAKTPSLLRTRSGQAKQNPLIAIAQSAGREVRALEGRLGITSSEQVEVAALNGAGAGSAVLTRRDLAVALGVHIQTVTKWEQEGLPVAERGRRGRPSKYRVGEVRAWLAARESNAAGKNGHVDVAAERARRERAQAILAEQMFQVRNRDLLPRVEVERLWRAEVTAVRTKLLSWATQLADRLCRAATLDGPAGVEAELDVAVRDVLLELADPDRAIEAAAAAPLAVNGVVADTKGAANGQ